MTGYNHRAHEPFNRYKRIRAVIALPGLVIFSQIYFFQPLLPTLVESFSVSPAMSSLTISAGMFGIAFGLLLLAIWADRWERKKTDHYLFIVGFGNDHFIRCILEFSGTHCFLLSERHFGGRLFIRYAGLYCRRN
jgi:MFS family permease